MENFSSDQFSQQPCLQESEICRGYERHVGFAIAAAKAKGLVTHNERVGTPTTGSILSLYYAGLSSSTNTPSVQLPQFADTKTTKHLHASNCPPRFLNVFNRWAQITLQIQTLSQLEGNELERIICNQPPSATPSTPSSYTPRYDVSRVREIANSLYSIAFDISLIEPKSPRHIKANIAPMIVTPKWPEPNIPKTKLLVPHETPSAALRGPPSPLSCSPLSPRPSPRLSPQYGPAPNLFEQIGAPGPSVLFPASSPKTDGYFAGFPGSEPSQSSFIGGFGHAPGFTDTLAPVSLPMPFSPASPFSMPEPRISRALSEGRATVYTYSGSNVGMDDAAGAADQIAAVISSNMSISDIIKSLHSHGCRDISQQLDASSFSPRPVSRGGFSDIYFGRLRDGTPIAIKTVFIHNSDHEQERKYLKRTARELYTWSKCNHRNVANLLGLAEFREQIVMVSAWMENGDLRTYVNKYPTVDRLKLCTQVAEGLAYLHSIGIIHGDLKGPNVLISKEGVATVIDFGNAILEESALEFTDEATSQKISLRWTAPEILRGSKHSVEADVYALGMLLQGNEVSYWGQETFTGKAPYIGKNDRAVMQAVTKNENPERPHQCIHTNNAWGDSLWSLIVQCWNHVPERRPTAIKTCELVSIPIFRVLFWLHKCNL
ncbi:hypothetical protein FRC12_000085 [Ceratobasidium sp. 428]|nr:hypothetical protein FRC12_000085 [Ceratobasidium sp. 428]